jgi:hypothetical protein
VKAVMFDVEKLLTGKRCAVLGPATTGDRCRPTPDDQWVSINNHPVGSQAAVVSHYGRHTSKVGGLMTIRSLATNRVYTFQIVEIRLVRASELTADELAALGHDDRDSFDEEWGESLEDRRCWLQYLIPTDTATQIN